MRTIELEYDGIDLEVHIENEEDIEIVLVNDYDESFIDLTNHSTCCEIEELALEKYREDEISYRVDQARDFNRGL